MTERSWVRILLGAGVYFSSLSFLVSLSLTINSVSSIRSLTEVQCYWFSWKKCMLRCTAWGKASLILTDWAKKSWRLSPPFFFLLLFFPLLFLETALFYLPQMAQLGFFPTTLCRGMIRKMTSRDSNPRQWVASDWDLLKDARFTDWATEPLLV